MHAMRLKQLRLLAIPRFESAIAFPPAQRQYGGIRGVWTPAGRYRRKTPPRRKDVPLFEVSERVLELDAEDSPFVRPYTDDTDGVEAAEIWRHAYDSVDALSERLGQFAQEAERAENRMRSVASSGSTPWRVTDHDIWSVALLGSNKAQAVVAAMEAAEAAKAEPSSSETTDVSSQHQNMQETQSHMVGEVLYQNGILARSTIEPSETIEFLLHRQRLAAKNAKNGRPNDHAWDSALASCSSLVEIRRLLAQACRSAAGRSAVTRNDRLLADRLLVYLPFAVGSGGDVAAMPTSAEETTPAANIPATETVSAMLLNASYCGSGTTTTTTVLGPHLCAVGLQAAAATGEPAAVQRFLELGQRSVGLDTAVIGEAVHSALSILHAQLRGEKGARRLYGSRADVFRLLTGACLVEKDSADASRRGIRAALVRPAGTSNLAAVAPPTWAAYLAAVAELGGVRTLWAAQHAPGSPVGLVTADVLVTGVLRYAAYTRAAGNSSARTIAKIGQATDASRLDLEVICAYEGAAADGRRGRTAPQPLPLATLRPEPWTAQPLAEPADSPLREDVARAFAEESMHSCMAAINRLLERHGHLRLKI